MKHHSMALPLLAVMLCAGAPAHADAMPTAQAKPDGKTSKTAPPRWTLARQKPNGSGLAVRYTPPPTVKLGQTALIELQVSGATGDAQIELRSSQAELRLEIDGVPASPAPIALRAGEVRRLQLRATAGAEGLYYVNVFTTQGGRSSVTGIRVKVGDGVVQLKPGGTVQTTPSGERIISLPASR